MTRTLTGGRLVSSGLAVVVLLLLVASPCSARSKDAIETWLGERDGCVIVYDLTDRSTVLKFNPARASRRVPACSTFKIATAVMAFDRGLLEGPQTAFRWDGQDRGRDEVNRDQTAASWLGDSVVWVTQALTSRLGMATVKRYLRAFRYGNEDMSGGLTRAWLMSSLRVSPDEEIAFLRSLWWERLGGASPPAQRAAVALLPRLALPDGGTLVGKTGSGLFRDGRDLGWYVGYLVKPNGRAYAIVVNFEDRVKGVTSGPGGFFARGLAMRIATGLQ